MAHEVLLDITYMKTLRVPVLDIPKACEEYSEISAQGLDRLNGPGHHYPNTNAGSIRQTFRIKLP